MSGIKFYQWINNLDFTSVKCHYILFLYLHRWIYNLDLLKKAGLIVLSTILYKTFHIIDRALQIL